MKYIYLSSVLEPVQFKKYREKYSVESGLQQQKFHQNFINGLMKNKRNVEVISHIQLEKSCEANKIVFDEVCEGDVVFNKSFKTNRKYLGNLGSLIRTLKMATKKCNSDDIIIVDYINFVALICAVATKLLRKATLAMIITDLPAWYYSKQLLGKKYGLIDYLQVKWLKSADLFILISEHISELDEFKGTEYVVYEGSLDIDNILERRISDENYLLYSGQVDKSNGIDMLIECWDKGEISQKLMLYGKCKDEQILKRISEIENVEYMGVVDNSVIEEYQAKALFLVNSRRSFHKYNRYSFPSKMIEYLSSGRPTISTKFEGMPKEYEDKVIWIEDESVDSLTQQLKQIINNHLVHGEIGAKAREFMIREKNTAVQVNKVLKKLEGDVHGR